MTDISGIGWVTSTGMGCGKDHSAFDMSSIPLPPIERKSVFDRPDKNFGRMDEFSRLGLAAVTFALRDAGLEHWESKRNIGIIAATGYGCLWTDIDYYKTVIPKGGILASPNLFAYTLPNCFLGEAAIRFGLTGDSYVINVSSISDLTCLRLALNSLAIGETDKIVCGFCDLGRPAQLEGQDTTTPGALFLVIENQIAPNRRRYGQLDLAEDGSLLFESAPVKDTIALAATCLKHKPGD
jgi:3-oxoacyl-[acyl-carrier-protein] synthase II